MEHSHLKKKLISFEEGTVVKKQHSKPCSDCPFLRDALPGWLAGTSPKEWMAMAHGETLFECHVLLGAQCAGSAIYRANVCKVTKDQHILKLRPDRKLVFASPAEFLDHHGIDE